MEEGSQRKASAGMHFHSLAVIVFVFFVIFNERYLAQYKWEKNKNILLNFAEFYTESPLKMVQEKIILFGPGCKCHRTAWCITE